MLRLLGRRRVDGLPLPAADRSEAVTVLATAAAALDSGVVLLDGYDVVLANEPARALRVVRGTAITAPVISRLLRDARRRQERVDEEVELRWGGGQRPVAVTVVPVPGSQRAVVLLRDLYEPRRVEAVRRDFVANVSHELKTPVGGLLLLAEALRDAADDPAAARRFADRVSHEAGRLAQLVDGLIDLSRLQGGDPLPVPVPIPVSRLVQEAADRVRVAADAAGIELAIADLGDLEVWGDERSLGTALANLLDNALHYSGPGTQVAVGARLGEYDGADEVEITVRDQGLGIDAADLGRVFERFYRADPARSRRTGGTGLGLAIVKHVVGNAGGRVSVWSQPGRGSTFTLHLPVPPAAPPVQPVRAAFERIVSA